MKAPDHLRNMAKDILEADHPQFAMDTSNWKCKADLIASWLLSQEDCAEPAQPIWPSKEGWGHGNED